MNDVRQLTSRELATIRAALRLWVETPAELIPDRCYEEVAAADDIEGDSAIEQLLTELSGVDVVDVVVRVPCDLTVTIDKRCDQMTPAGYAGHWRDWHRGHGCHLDPDATTKRVAAPPGTPLEPLD